MANRSFRRYLASPRGLWRGVNRLQAEKLERQLARAKAAHGEDALERVEARARLRRERSALTIHVANMGGSGSHWLEALLAEAGACCNAGEVYFPRWVRYAPVGRVAKREFIEAVQLLHADPALEADPLMPVSNSAHVMDFPGRRALGADLRRVLLLRNPVDIVLSRSFRKADYRGRVAPVASDLSYVDDNIRLVGRFFRCMAKRRFDAVVRYEALLADGEAALAGLIHSLGLSVSGPALREAIACHDRKRAGPGPRRSRSNPFRGREPAAVADFRPYVTRALARERALFGYDSDPA